MLQLNTYPGVVGRSSPNAHGGRGRRATVRSVGGPWSRLLLALLAVLLAGTGAAGCTRVVAGTPAAAPPHAFPATPTARSGSVRVGAAVPGDTGTPGPTTDAGTATGSAGPEAATLAPDVIADECLLDTAQFTALLGRPMRPPVESVVQRDDGSRSSLCYAGPVDGAGPAAAMNVYRVRAGTPAQFVRAAGGRALSGAGEVAKVLDTAAGPTLQVASARFLVTVVVQGREPDDAAWRAAARAALARLPG